MKKLVFLAIVMLISVAALSLPSLSYSAQVGVILTGDIPYYQQMHRAFSQAIRQAGNVEIVLQTPSPDPIAWSNAARKMEAIGVDVIVTYGGPATLAAVREASRTPVVFAGVSDYQALGISGKKVTGISSKVQPTGVLKNLKAIKPFDTLGIVYSSTEKDTTVQAAEIERLEGQFGFKSVKIDFRSPSDAGKLRGVDAIYITTSCSAQQCLSKIVGVARSLKAPTATTVSGGENMGIILTVAADAEEQGARAAELVGRVLEGASPAGIPVEVPRKIELVLNLREATSMGLKVPLDVLTSASRVVK
jgi:putative ABC transport system substrate-binding protein